ncbi:MAG: 3-deoxy-D-manno-octulosonate 8-phosphate phosphatase [Elusimicrobia bacterium HGW-Elusimicrobia-4]|nr:MAG: 3-deoxy-D-manno-octulosonate 8-phosphate phosphatase [Elusimicrobia bacterium HGW-Elusimicrobia-4]
MRIKKKIFNKARKIKLLATDVDGVLTDGKIVILNNGEELKFWDAYDRFAFTLLRNYAPGMKIAWITGRTSPQVAARAKEVGVHYLYQKCMKKMTAVSEISKKENLSVNEIAFIGDDLVDLPALLRCGFSACPKNAPSDVKEAVDYVTNMESGKGVFREVVEIIFRSQGLWKKVLENYR